MTEVELVEKPEDNTIVLNDPAPLAPKDNVITREQAAEQGWSPDEIKKGEEHGFVKAGDKDEPDKVIEADEKGRQEEPAKRIAEKQKSQLRSLKSLKSRRINMSSRKRSSRG